ncbi:hypothetical protein N7488_000487 [Penicillium malachiteum]|nr:hypothetical protein N7488_000487 [Penicillium malachiteum]
MEKKIATWKQQKIEDHKGGEGKKEKKRTRQDKKKTNCHSASSSILGEDGGRAPHRDQHYNLTSSPPRSLPKLQWHHTTPFYSDPDNPYGAKGVLGP